MAKVIIGRKLGMTQFFTEDGARIAVTVIQAGPCPVSQVKTAGGPRLRRRPARLRGGARAQALEARARAPREERHRAAPPPARVPRRASSSPPGEVVTVEGFEPGDAIKVSGRSKGKGFAGTIKRHGFSRGPVSHGSHNVRAPGSIGQSATPSRVIKGVRMAGHMGTRNITQRGLQVLDRDVERNLLLVTGAVPGPTGGLVFVREDR